MLMCLYVHILGWSHAHVFTCFDNYMFTCLHALIIGSNALMITCFYIHVLGKSYAPMFACFDDRMLPCLHALTITCPHAFAPSCLYVWMLWWSHAHMHLCCYAHMFLLAWLSHLYMEAHILPHSLLDAHFLDCSHVLTCPHAFAPSCLYVWMLWWSHAHMHLCCYAHMFLLAWLSHLYMEAHILPHSLLDAHFLDCSHAWMLTRLHVLMITCSHALLIRC